MVGLRPSAIYLAFVSSSKCWQWPLYLGVSPRSICSWRTESNSSGVQ